MNPEQKSITLAFLVVLGAVSVRNDWYKRFKVWIVSSPGDAAKNAPTPTKTQYGVRNWQAAMAMYIILMVLADTPVAPVTTPIAWGVGLIEALAALGSGTGTLPTEFPGVFGQSTVSNPLPPNMAATAISPNP